jgi:hypothetical protein
MAFEIKRNDRRPRWRVQLVAGDPDAPLPVDLTAAVAVRFTMKSGSTLKVNKQPMTIVDALTGLVEYPWDDGDTDTSGDYNVEVEVDWGGTPAEYQTFPSVGYFTVSITDDLA